MKYVLLIFALLFGAAAHAGPMANVEYIHKVIEQRWGVAVPYNPALENPQVAANMKYLLTAVDVTNNILNGEAITDYGNGEYATLAAADTVATLAAAKDLIQIKPRFFITTTDDTTEFNFKMSAAGYFMIDWGDGVTDYIRRTDTDVVTYSHTYTDSEPRSYTISIGGKATAYTTAYGTEAIAFYNNLNIAGISGSLGAIFGTVVRANGTLDQPTFDATFAYCENLEGPLPENLFTGIYGRPKARMFMWTFLRCYKLSGEIPPMLFGELYGAPSDDLFRQTFLGDTKLSGRIPAGLFGKLEGRLTSNLFMGTFSGCTGLTGCIPNDWFSGLDATLGEIINEYGPFTSSGITQSLCPVE